MNRSLDHTRQFLRDTDGAISTRTIFIAVSCTVASLVITAETLRMSGDDLALEAGLSNTEFVRLDTDGKDVYPD